MTQPRNSPVKNPITKLHSTYRLIYQRRLNWLISREMMSLQNLQASISSPPIEQYLQCVDTLSNILMKVMNLS